MKTPASAEAKTSALNTAIVSHLQASRNTLMGSTQATMSSREIATLVEKRHDNVKRLIETLAANGLITPPQFEEVSNTGPGPKSITAFRVGKRDSFVIVAQLSPEFTARLVDRWQVLEQVVSSSSLSVPQSLPEALRLAADLAEQATKASAQLAIAAPKASALDRIAAADGTACISDAAKALKVAPQKLFIWLQMHKWIFRRAGGASWIAFQDRIQAGLLTHRVSTVQRSDGTEKTVAQVLVTANGLTVLAVKLGAAP